MLTVTSSATTKEVLKMRYKPGDKVEVFEDPLTRQRSEGIAVVVRWRRTEHYYDVDFGDGYGILSRFVYPPDMTR